MTLTVTHAYNSTVAEDPASGTPGGLVGPNEWNAAHTWAGATSGGVLYFSGATTAASSAALAANALVIGGGAGAAPFTASGTSWDNTNLALTITGATVTTSNPILNLSQTWNAGGVTFTALKLNVTNTASAAASKLFDFQLGGGSILNLTNSGGAGGNAQLNTGCADLFITTATGGGQGIILWDGSTVYGTITQPGAISLGSPTNHAQIQAYNSVDSLLSPTNYERGVFDWTTSANVLTIGTQAGGTGTLRAVQFVGTDFVHGASVATNATDGFLYIPSCAGTPTGTPTTFTGTVPMVYDRTNNKFYIYNGGWKGGTNPGAFT